MKKLSPQYKQRLLYASVRELDKRHRLNKNSVARKQKIIVLPEKLSLHDRPSHKALCLAIQDIKRWVKSPDITHVVLDFSHVRIIWPEGMLLLFAEMDIINRLRGKTSFKIKPPVSSRCMQVLVKIGFYEILGKAAPAKKLTDETVVHWQVMTDTNVNAEKLKKIHKDKEKVKELYVPITEAMDNCIYHGYLDEGKGKKDRCDYFTCQKAIPEKQKWWLFSQIKDNELYVALADLGIGFPRSLRESNAAKTKGLWAYITNKLQREEGRLPDHKILREVVEAEQNITSTEQANRGKGIAQITQLAREDEHSGLAIWSYKGGYIMKKEKSSATRRGSAIKYSESIQGTIIYWSIPIAGGEL
jgi:hypothetical protein